VNSIPYGIETAACALIGNKIGEGNVVMAKKYSRYIILYSFVV